MTREQMLAELQRDVNAWPKEVRDAGVKKSNGTAYVPIARNNEILRTPDDAEATYAYMLRVWGHEHEQTGSAGWDRIIADAGPELTWEWLIADDERCYAELFPDDMRQRVLRALEADAGTAEWRHRRAARAEADQAQRDRIAQVREEMRSGKRPRLKLPELDGGL